LKTAAALVLALVMVFALMGAALASPVSTGINVTINGERINLDTNAIVVDGTTYVPLRYVTELLQGRVKWDPVQGKFVISPGGWLPYPERQWDSRFTFGFVFDKDNPYKIGLAVKNKMNTEVVAMFPTSKTHDIVVKSNGSVVWRASDGTAYAQAVRTDKFAPGETRVYDTTVPMLVPGSHTIEGYFMAADRPDRPAVISPLSLPSGANLLQYGLSFTKGFFSGGPKISFSVRNTLGQDVLFPAGHAYKLVVKDSSGQVVLTKSMGAFGNDMNYDRMEKGSSRFYFMNLGKLSAGSYTAEVSRAQGPTELGRVAATWFHIS